MNIRAAAFVLTALFAACLATAQDGEKSADPAPQKVAELEPLEAPRPAPFPELTFHTAPRPLADGARVVDFPGFLGADRDAHTSDGPLLQEWPEGGPTLVWEMTRGEGYAAPAVQGERLVYIHRVSAEAVVDCLHVETGQRFWTFRYPCDYRGRYIANGGTRATPTIDGERVYVHGVEGVLHCLELTTGRVVWKRDLHADFSLADGFFGVVSSPLVHGELLIVNVGQPGPSVAAFRKDTGSLVWATPVKWGASCASPIVANVHGRERLLVLTGGDSRPPTGALMSLDPATGAIDFEYPFRSRTYESVNGATPIVEDDRVILTSSYNVGTAALALDDEGGYEELWKDRSLGLQFQNPVFFRGRVWAVDGTSDRAGAVVSVDPASGEELSRTDLAWDEETFYQGSERTLSMSVGEGSLLVVGEQLLCLGDNGHLLLLDATDEGVTIRERAWLFRANESWTPLVLSRGLLFACQNGREHFGAEPRPARLLCFDLRGR